MPAISPERRAAIRESIELAAIDCFTSKGFHGTTTRQIAEAASLSTGGLYAHYKSKDELFVAVLARYRRLFASDDNPLLAHLANTRFPDDIPELAIAIESLIRTHKDFWLLWYVDVIEFDGKHFRDDFLTSLPQHPALDVRLAEVDGDGSLRVEATLAFRMVYMHLFNFLLVEILFGGRDHYGVPSERAVAAISDVFRRGILSEDDRR